MKSHIALAVAAIMFAGSTAYAMQGMSCCENCSCCNQRQGNDRQPAAPPKQ